MVRGTGTDHNVVRGDEVAGSDYHVFIGGQGEAGSAAQGNGSHGVVVSDQARYTHLLNVSILGNQGDGVRIVDPGTDHTTVESCKIGHVAGNYDEVITAAAAW